MPEPNQTKWAICSTCKGEGSSSAYLGAFTREDMDNLGDDFLDDYVHGAYNRPCEACNGTGKVKRVKCEECNHWIEGNYLRYTNDWVPTRHHPCDAAEISEARYFAMFER